MPILSITDAKMIVYTVLLYIYKLLFSCTFAWPTHNSNKSVYTWSKILLSTLLDLAGSVIFHLYCMDFFASYSNTNQRQFQNTPSDLQGLRLFHTTLYYYCIDN